MGVIITEYDGIDYEKEYYLLLTENAKVYAENSKLIINNLRLNEQISELNYRNTFILEKSGQNTIWLNLKESLQIVETVKKLSGTIKINIKKVIDIITLWFKT